jgi:hypothetical protein
MSTFVNPLHVDDPTALLRAACARSSVLELHRAENNAATPAARARLLGFSKSGNLLLDRPQVIGRQVPLGMGQTVDAFFQFDDELYTFATSVLRIDVPVRLNDDKRVFGAEIAAPKLIKKGQRRAAFRTSLALQDPLPVRLHRTSAEDPYQTPISAHRFEGYAVDGSQTGLGVRIEGVPYTRFTLFDQYFLAFTCPGETEETVLLTELRQRREIKSGQAAKLGFLVLPWPTQRAADIAAQPLHRFLMDVQRRVRKAG